MVRKALEASALENFFICNWSPPKDGLTVVCLLCFATGANPSLVYHDWLGGAAGVDDNGLVPLAAHIVALFVLVVDRSLWFWFCDTMQWLEESSA